MAESLPLNTRPISSQIYLDPDNNLWTGKEGEYFKLDQGDNYVLVGSNITLLNNNANYISSGTASNQVRNNTDLDARYLQTETDPTVGSHIKAISIGDLNAWNSKLTDITAGTNITIDKTNPLNPIISASAGITGLVGDVEGSGTGAIGTTITNNAITTAKIENSAVTLAKIQNINRKTLIGLGGGGTNTWTYKQAWGSTGIVDPWSSNVAYSSGSYCIYNGNLYLASGFPGMGVPPPNSPWTLVVNNFAGIYSNSASYNNGQHVAVVNDGIYQTSAPIAGIAPGETVNNTPGPPVAITIGNNLILGADNVLRASQSTNIAGLIQAGTNVVITGSGYPSNPYIINATGSGGGGGSTNIYAGTNISVSGNSSTGYTINNTYTLPVASGSTLGGVKAGSGVTIAGDGTISATGGGGGGGSFRLRSASNPYLTGDVSLVAGSNVSFSQSGNNITINASGGGSGGGGISALTGDVLASGSGTVAATIANGVVSNTKLANMTANTIKGRITSSGSPQDLSSLDVRKILDTVGTNNTTVIDMSGPKYIKLSAINSNTTYTLSNNYDGASIQATVTNIHATNNVSIGISGAIGLGSLLIPPGKVSVVSIQDFGGGTIRYTVVSQI